MPMCFYNHCEWYASICETDTARTSAHPVACDECGRAIPPGTPYTHVFMQEHEDEGPDDEDEGPDDESEEFDPGETFDYDRCGDCSRLLDAVGAEEVSRGCHAYESRPPLTAMQEQIGDLDPADRRAYRVRALAMFPDMGAEYLDRMLGAEDES